MAKNKAINVILNLKDKFTKPVQKSAAEVKKFEREVKRTENNVKKGFANMSKGAKDNAKKMANDFGKSIDDMTKKAAKWATIGAGGALVGKGIADTVNVGRTFEQSMANVAATVGINKSSADGIAAYEALENKAREVAKVSKFTASEVAESMNFLAMAGWKQDQMMGEGLDKMLQLAAASSTDVATTTDIVSDALTAFSMSANEAGKFADIMAATASNANTNVSMMGETFTYAAPVAGALGHSAEDTALAIGLMGNAGIKASQAGTALRTMLTNLQGTVELSGKQLGKWVVECENSDGSMRNLRDIIVDLREGFAAMTESEKAANAEALAGKTGMSGLLAVVNASEADFNKLANAIDNSEGATARMEEVMMDTVNGAMAIMMSTLDELRLKVWDKIKTPLKNHIRAFTTMLPKAFDKATAAARKMGNFFKRITKTIKDNFGMMIRNIKEKVFEHEDLIKSMRKVYDKVVEVLGKVKDVGKRAFEAMEPSIEWLMKEGIPTLVGWILDWWDACRKVHEFIIDNWGNIVPVVLGVAAAFATYKAIMFGIAAWTVIYNGVQTICKGVTLGMAAAQGILNTALLSNPIGLVVAAVGALIAVGTYLIMNWDKVKASWQDTMARMRANFEDFVNPFIKGINLCIDGLNRFLSFKMPKWLGGFEFNSNIPNIPEFATGTSFHRGGLARINEGGRGEIVNLPNGSQVIPHDISKKAAANNNGATITVPITIQGNVYGDNDLIDRVGGKIVQRVKLAIDNV